jgi:hypothetical protein
VFLAASSVDNLPDVLSVATIASSLVGAVIGTFVQSWSTRQFLENVALGAAIGLVLGGVLGFCLWAGAQVG